MCGSTFKKASLVILVFYSVLLAGLALYDEDPDPEWGVDKAGSLPEVIEPGNAWIAFLGFRAPKGVSPFAWGAEKMRRVRNAFLSGGNMREVLREVNDDSGGLRFRGKVSRFFGKGYCGAPAYAAAHTDEIAALLQRNEEMLRRYESLRSYPRYREPIDYGGYAPTPWFLPIKECAFARMLQLAVEAAHGNTTRALAGLREETDLWRFIARNSSTVLSKMVAFAILSFQMRMAADLAACGRLTSSERTVVRHILRPFQKEELGLGATLRGEVRFIRASMELALGGKGGGSRLRPVVLIFKTNATRNRIHQYLHDSILLAEMDPQKFSARVSQRDGQVQPRGLGLPFLYNPLGEILSLGAQQLAGVSVAFIASGHDVEGLRRLLLLKVLACEKRITRDQMEGFLAANREELGNPYTGAAMEWDPAGFIVFRNHRGVLKESVKYSPDACKNMS